MPLKIYSQEPDTTMSTEQQLLNDVTKASSAALAFLCLNVDEAIAALEAQPAHYNIASAADFRTLEFDAGNTASCAIRGWKLKWGLYIIPGLRGVVTPPDDKRQGRFIPFEQFLPKSAEHGIDYVELVAAVACLTRDAVEAAEERGDGQDN